jgi:transposase
MPPKPANLVITDPAAKPAKEAITDFGAELSDGVPQPSPSRSASASAPFRDAIELGISRGRNVMAIWQDLVDHCRFTGSYQSVPRFVRKLHPGNSLEACAVIETAPGEECQVDYGAGPMVRDPVTGKYRRTRLFVMTLGYSRKSVRLLVFRSSSQIWAELHEKAFRWLTGATRVVVLDNLREGVLTPDIYDPTLNPVYRDVLHHYGAVALPCRIADPDRKGKVESGVGHAQRTPLKGLRFESLEEAQSYLDHWEARWADTRIHGTTKRQVAAMFAEEKPALLPLPVEPFRYYQYGERTVHLDGCVEVEAAYYSAHQAGSIGVCRCNGMLDTSACWTHRPASYCASTCDRGVDAIGSKMKIVPGKLRSARCNCSPELTEPALRSAFSAAGCIANTGRLPCAASRACCRWPRSTELPAWTMLAPPPWKWAFANTVLCAATWKGTHNCH